MKGPIKYIGQKQNIISTSTCSFLLIMIDNESSDSITDIRSI